MRWSNKMNPRVVVITVDVMSERELEKWLLPELICRLLS